MFWVTVVLPLPSPVYDWSMLVVVVGGVADGVADAGDTAGGGDRGVDVTAGGDRSVPSAVTLCRSSCSRCCSRRTHWFPLIVFPLPGVVI